MVFAESNDSRKVLRKTPKTASLWICVILTALLIVMLVPIIRAAFYCRPIADDLIYSTAVHNAIENKRGFIEVIKAAIRTAISTYKGWQGTFSAVFIFALQPGVYGLKWYWITTVLMIGALVFSTLFFLYTLSVKLHQKGLFGIIIGLLVLIDSIQFVPDKAEAYYWFNGSSYYTLFYCFSLIWITLIIRLLIKTGKENAKLMMIVLLILSFLIGGGNYSTALLCIEFAMILLIVCIIGKAKERLRIMFPICLVLIISFFISIIAPGNKVRAATVTGTTPVRAIFLSVYYYVRYVIQWTKFPQIALVAFSFPALYNAAKATRFDFRFPLLTISALILFFSSQLTPPLFAMSMVGYGRQVNIYYYSYYLLMLLIEFYLAGWISHKLVGTSSNDRLLNRRNCMRSIIVFTAIIWFMGCLEAGFETMTSIATAKAYYSGELKTYAKEYDDMTAMLETAGSDDVVETTGISTVPSFFLGVGINDDPSYWINDGVKGYYGVKGVVLKT